MLNEEQIRLLELQSALLCRRGRKEFAPALSFLNPNFELLWFHRLIAEKCEQLIKGTLGKDRLMVFMPPQHGKSEVVSRLFPCWCLGTRPGIRIVGVSYSASLAQQFSLAIQRNMDDSRFRRMFPNVFLSGQSDIPKEYKNSKARRNIDYFETLKFKGFYKAVGVGGSLTGTPVDLGIIDDPIKDALEANSTTYRERVWQWYTDVFLTRLHNHSKQIIIQTRWHDDDLSGRILEREADKWEVVCLPAIKEVEGNKDDPRKVGEALWEERHSVERLREIEQRSPKTFAALYQQHPTQEGGNIVKNEWFKRVSVQEFAMLHKGEPIHFFLDTAYTDKTDNDPSGILCACRIGNELYITDAKKMYLKFPDLCRFIPDYTAQRGYTAKSTIRIEPKANGISVIDQLRASTHLNVTKTPTPKESKETRLSVISPLIECGRVVMVDGSWCEGFLDEVCGFPKKPHDEFVDVLCYACDYLLISQGNELDKKRLLKMIY